MRLHLYVWRINIFTFFNNYASLYLLWLRSTIESHTLTIAVRDTWSRGGFVRLEYCETIYLTTESRKCCLVIWSGWRDVLCFIKQRFFVFFLLLRFGSSCFFVHFEGLFEYINVMWNVLACLSVELSHSGEEREIKSRQMNVFSWKLDIDALTRLCTTESNTNAFESKCKRKMMDMIRTTTWK